jgi:hypothetical protein
MSYYFYAPVGFHGKSIMSKKWSVSSNFMGHFSSRALLLCQPMIFDIQTKQLIGGFNLPLWLIYTVNINGYDDG